MVSKPRYAQIADDIRARIASGEYAPGSQLPTKAVLMDQWHAALNTVARAITELQQEGLVETFHGVGSFVRAQPSDTEDDAGDYDEMEALRVRVEHLEALMQEVFSNLGLPYPDAPSTTAAAREAV